MESETFVIVVNAIAQFQYALTYNLALFLIREVNQDSVTAVLHVDGARLFYCVRVRAQRVVIERLHLRNVAVAAVVGHGPKRSHHECGNGRGSEKDAAAVQPEILRLAVVTVFFVFVGMEFGFVEADENHHNTDDG